MEIDSKQCWVAAAQLIQAHAELEERFSAGLGAIHGLSLKEAMLLLHVAQAEGRRLSRIDLAKRLSIRSIFIDSNQGTKTYKDVSPDYRVTQFDDVLKGIAALS